MKKYFFVVSTFILCYFLGISDVFSQAISSKTFTINGDISGMSNGTIVRLIDIDQLKIVDSASTRDGKFKFSGSVEKPTSFWVKCLNEYAIIQVENLPMTFSASIKDMKLNYLANGGKEQALQTALNVLVRPFEKIYSPAYDSISNKLYKDGTDLSRLTKIFNEANDKYMAAYITFGKKHINTYVGLDIVYRNRKSIPVDSISFLTRNLPIALRNTDNAKGLLTYTSENIVKKGGRYLDFESKDIEGKPFKFSSLKGKYIYLTFGSFGCAPCRMENQYISKNYAVLSKNLHIVNFSLDVNVKEWLATAKVDNIKWYNVSDLEGMSGRIKTLYNVSAMPTSFLIDKNGLVIEKFEGYNVDNFEKIEKLITIK